MPRQLKLGFTLIEVLVTLVILMFGMLGIAGLMAKGQRVSFEAYQRHQALQIANEMAERMRANRLQATQYAAAAVPPTGIGTGAQYTDQISDTCSVTACDAAALKNYDIALWVGLLQGQAELSGGNPVGGIINARGCIQQTAETSATCPGAPAPANNLFTQTYRVSVSWQGNDATAAPVDGNGTPLTCGEDLYGDDEARRRVVSVDVLLQFQCP